MINRYQDALNAVGSQDLSEAERSTIELALAGTAIAQIAQTLDISEVAVRKRLGEVYRKFGISGKGPGKLAELKRQLEHRAAIVPKTQSHHELAEAPDVSVFYGRDAELDSLQDWICAEACRLVAIVGVGGIGKTSLAAKLANDPRIDQTFDLILWRSLKDAPPLSGLIANLIASFTRYFGAPEIGAKAQPQSITQVLEFFRRQRCLVIFDNVESLFQPGYSSVYQAEHRAYGDFFKRVGESVHQSCVILTTREKPREIAALEGETLPVRSYALPGLNEDHAEQILQAKGVTGTRSTLRRLMKRYDRNPLALKIVATTIQELFGGSIAAFLEQSELTLVSDIRALLAQQFDRVSQPERDLMYWLAINRRPVSLIELQEDLVSPIAKRQVLEDLEALKRRSLLTIEERDNLIYFTLHPVILEYVTDRLIEQMHQEILSGELAVFESHILVKAASEVEISIKDAQVYRILEPLVEALIESLGNRDRIKTVLLQFIETLQQSPLAPSYAAANCLRLLSYLHINLEGNDFSNLSIRQAELTNMQLQQVNFSHSNFFRCNFTDVLDSILCVAVSADHQWLAAGDCDGIVHLWQAASGKKVHTWKAHENWVRSLAFSPDSQWLASGSDDHTIQLWSVRASDPQARYATALIGHLGWVWSIAFSPDGTYLVSASSDRTLRLWRVSDGTLSGVIEAHQDFVRTVAFSPDGTQIASGGADGIIKVWTIHDRRCVNEIQSGQNRLWSIAFSPDGQRLGSAGDDRTIRIWDVERGTCEAVLTGHQDVVRSIAFNQNNYLVSGSDDTTLRLWDLSTQHCVATLEGHDSRVWSIAFSPDGKTIISGSDDKTVRLWSVARLRCVRELQGYTNMMWSIAYSPDGKTIASGSDDKLVRLWTPPECRVLGEHDGRVWSVAFSPDGQWLATGGDDRVVRLWNLNTEQFRIIRRSTAWIRTVTFSPDSKILAIAGDNQRIQRWDLQQEQWLKPLQGHQNSIRSIAFSSDNKTIISGSDDETIRIWDLETATATVLDQSIPDRRNRIWSIALHPDGQRFASGGDSSTIKLWRLSDHQIDAEFDQGKGFIRAIAIDPSGRFLASGGTTGTIKLWDVETGRCLRHLDGHKNWIRAIAFSPDGTTIASASQDWSIRLWDVKTGRCQHTLCAPRIYEGMRMTGATGLSAAQQRILQRLGATF